MIDGEPKTVVSASLQKIKSIKNPLFFFIVFFFFLIKSETSDSFVNHFDGHFAYLKTLDCYFKGFTFGTFIGHFQMTCLPLKGLIMSCSPSSVSASPAI